MFIDLKGNDMKLVEAINNIYKQYPELYDLALITSFNPFLIYKVSVMVKKFLILY